MLWKWTRGVTRAEEPIVVSCTEISKATDAAHVVSNNALEYDSSCSVAFRIHIVHHTTAGCGSLCIACMRIKFYEMPGIYPQLGVPP